MTSREEKARRKKLVQQQKRPNACLEDHPRTLGDEFLRYVEVDGHPIYDGGNKVTYPVRKCSVCGKEYVDAPAMA